MLIAAENISRMETTILNIVIKIKNDRKSFFRNINIIRNIVCSILFFHYYVYEVFDDRIFSKLINRLIKNRVRLGSFSMEKFVYMKS